jgi:Icc-related predicted phosphoesterase
MHVEVAKRVAGLIALPVMLMALQGCSDMFSYSPFDTNVPANEHNISATSFITNDTTGNDTLQFAFFSDSHDSYDELESLISNINHRNDIQFVISGGDITTFGLSWEYQKYFNLIKKIRIPVVTAIGNHDYVSNGGIIYRRLFGPPNVSFACKEYKFIMFDDVVWENGNSPLNFSWLGHELDDSGKLNVIVAHLPPWDEQMDSTHRANFSTSVTSANTLLCLHGHTHTYRLTTHNGVQTLVAGDLKDREYYVVMLSSGQVSIERVSF